MTTGVKRFEDMDFNEKKKVFEAWVRNKKRSQAKANLRRKAIHQAWVNAGRPQTPEELPSSNSLLDLVKGRWEMSDLPPSYNWGKFEPDQTVKITSGRLKGKLGKVIGVQFLYGDVNRYRIEVQGTDNSYWLDADSLSKLREG